MRIELRGVAIALACWVLGGAAGIRAEDDAWTIERLEAARPLGPARAVAVRNVHGDVRCRVTERTAVEVLANVQRHREDPRKAEVRLADEDGRVTVEVVYPQGDAAGLRAEMERRRVDLTVLLPSTASLAVTTGDGLIEAKTLRQPFTATSESGRIVFVTSGTARVKNGRGAIEATFRATDWDAEVRLETATGDITVYLPPDAAARVEAETAGELSTDYSLTVEPWPRSSMKTAIARIGEGGGRLSLKSAKGRVRIFRSRW